MFDFILMHFPALSVSPLQYIHDMMGGGLTATDLKLLGTNRLCKDHRNWCRTTRGCACPSLGSLPLSGFSHFDPKQCSTDPRFRALSLPLPFVLLCISISSPLLPDPFLIVLFLPQSPPMPLFHPPAPALQPSLSGSFFSPGRTFTLSESEQNGRGREKEEHTWGQRSRPRPQQRSERRKTDSAPQCWQAGAQAGKGQQHNSPL